MQNQEPAFDVFVRHDDRGPWTIVAEGLCFSCATEVARESTELGLRVSVLPGGWRHGEIPWWSARGPRGISILH